MGKMSAVKRLSLEDVPGAPSWFETYLDTQNDFNEAAFSTINGNISLDNTNNALVPVKNLAHGVEQRMRNPLDDKNLRPVGVYAVRSDGLAVQSLGWRLISSKGQPDQLGVTAQFQPAPMGEQKRAVVAQASPVTLSVSGTAYDVTSLTLPAGVWDLTGIVQMIAAAITGTAFNAWIHTASATDPGSTTNGDNRVATPTVATAAASLALTIPQFRVSLAATTTYYLGAKAAFSAGTPTVCGRFSAVKVAPPTDYSANVSLFVVGG